jgi:CelD/BcsL family acetyltransferase involved in cellulose biosynthesis
MPALTLESARDQRFTVTRAPACRIERIAESDFCGPLQEEWQLLHDSLFPRTPFTAPLWNILWWKHFRSNGVLTRDELFAHTVRDLRGRLIAVAPMMVTERPSIGPLRMRTLRCFGADANVTELRGLVCSPSDEAKVLDLLRSHVTKQRRFDWIDWGAVRRQNWQAAAGPRTPPAAISGELLTDYQLSLPSSWEEFRAARARNIKESIRKCYNSLTRDGHSFELRVIESPADCAAGIRTFLELHLRRSEAANTIGHANVFESGAARAFLLEYAQCMAQRDQLRLFQIRIGGAVVASRIGFLCGDELYLYYSGYDTAWARYSVMTTLVVEAIKWAIQKGLRTVNLSTGTDVSKLRWGPTPTEYRNLVQVMLGLGAQLSFATYRLLGRRARRGESAVQTNGTRAMVTRTEGSSSWRWYSPGRYCGSSKDP